MKILLVFCVVWGASCIAWADKAATQVNAVALFQGKAMLSINGRNKTLKEGQTYKGVTLVKGNTSEAVIEVNGQQQTIGLGGGMAFSKSRQPAEGADSATLYADDRGFFFAEGRVNKQKVRFLVDTGASSVVFSSVMADELGIDYTSGQRTMALTASGQAPMYALTLKKVIVKGIELKNVEAGVILGSHPDVALLGMSFLKKLDMKREFNYMILKRRQ